MRRKLTITAIAVAAMLGVFATPTFAAESCEPFAGPTEVGDRYAVYNQKEIWLWWTNGLNYPPGTQQHVNIYRKKATGPEELVAIERVTGYGSQEQITKELPPGTYSPLIVSGYNGDSWCGGGIPPAMAPTITLGP